MALTKEDLQAIKGIVDESVKEIKTDVKGLKTDVKGLKTDVDDLKTNVKRLESDSELLKSNVRRLEDNIEKLTSRVTSIEVVQLENRVIPVLNEVHQYQQDVYERYLNGAKAFENKIALLDATADIVAEHSKQIQGLQTKMA